MFKLPKTRDLTEKNPVGNAPFKAYATPCLLFLLDKSIAESLLCLRAQLRLPMHSLDGAVGQPRQRCSKVNMQRTHTNKSVTQTKDSTNVQTLQKSQFTLI
jgi:hypothetical protein